MKKDNLAHNPQLPVETCPEMVDTQGHLHALNCGHKSFLHGDHVCYQSEGKFQFMHGSHAHACTGPGTPAPASIRPQTGKKAKVLSMDSARKAKQRK